MKNNIRKSAKRWLALVMTAIMVFAMGATVMAQGEDSSEYTITIENGTYNSGTTYDLYRIYNATVTDTNGEIGANYSLTTDFAGLSTTYKNDGSGITESNLEALIEAAMEIVNASSNAPSAAYTNMNAGTPINVLPGYYLIVPNGNAENGGTVTSPCLVAVPGDAKVGSTGSSGSDSKSVTVTPKSSATTIDKKITGGSTNISSSADSSTLAIGKTIQYTITSVVPDYGEDVDKTKITYTITDTASTSLDFVSVDSVITSTGSGSLMGTLAGTTSGENNDYYTMTTSAHGFVLTFNYAKLTPGDTITITATFKLNKDAAIGTANDNKVSLKYTNNCYENSTSDIDHTVHTYTFGFGINKIDDSLGTGSQALTGAEFEIYNSRGMLVATIKAASEGSVTITVYNGTHVTAQADDVLYTDTQTDTGSYAIKGLDAGEYTVKETKAPDGYSIGSEQTVTITADKTGNDDSEYNGTYSVNGRSSSDASFGTVTAHAVDINNDKGTTLPGTGGIGTTLFTFGGLALVILAAILFIVYTKKQRKQA